MTEFIKEADLNYDLILKRVGAYTQGDEDFDVFKCPVCNRIYLIEYEADTIFTDPGNLSALQSGESFSCLSCGYSFPKGEAIIGPKASDKYRVTRSELLASKWSWLLSQRTT
jgi:hypothetical protein